MQSLNTGSAVCNTSKSEGSYWKQPHVETDRFGSGCEGSTAKRQQSIYVVSLEFYLCIWLDLSALTHLFKSESPPPRGSAWRMPGHSWIQLAQSPAAFYTLAGWCAPKQPQSSQPDHAGIIHCGSMRQILLQYPPAVLVLGQITLSIRDVRGGGGKDLTVDLTISHGFHRPLK